MRQMLKIVKYFVGCIFVSGMVILYSATSYFFNCKNISLVYRNSLLSSEQNKLAGARGYFLEKCKCYKHITLNLTLQRLVSSGSGISTESTCGEEADWYGKGQKVLTYTLYENKNSKSANDHFSFLLDGILINLQQMRSLYPGWILRLYTDHVLDSEMCAYACLDDIMWCDIRQSRLGNLEIVNFRSWRFMTIGDPTVDIFVSRDLDSWIGERERVAVAQWENSNFVFHCMRDVPFHNADMWAGAWGAKNQALDPIESVNLRNAFMKGSENKSDTSLDETLLTELIFKKYPKDILVHDAYRCKDPKHITVPSVPFPTQRNQNNPEFVAITINRLKFGRYSAKPCPVECRPSYGLNWTYC